MKAIISAAVLIAMASAASAQCTKDTDCKGDRICIEGTCVAPEESGTAEGASRPRMDMGKAAIYLNPLGALQFGPIVGFEIGVGANVFLDLHWRYAAASLIYSLILTEGYEHYMSMGSMAVGGGARYFFPSSIPHRIYFGFMGEFGWGATWGEDSYDADEYDASSPDAWEGEERQIVLIANPGFRWRLGRSLFLNLGLYAGAAIDVKDEIVYINQNNTTEDYRGAMFFGMIEFALGWEFGL
ncbi:MAG: hypothetical protein GF418_16400 [Chitinivibrionales bacterium]|nr:hypothetical protein [Chitinivibrionales bacterium]MBD3397203.1 hypothetical protein [Chitinivibrionales bacterium]